MADLLDLPEVRFKPTLIVIQWSNGDEASGVQDFTDMVEAFHRESYLESTYTFSISPEDKNLDERLQKLLKIVKLDVNDSLMHVLSWQGMYELKFLLWVRPRYPRANAFFAYSELSLLFTELFKQYTSDWLDSCWTDDHCKSSPLCGVGWLRFLLMLFA